MPFDPDSAKLVDVPNEFDPGTAKPVSMAAKAAGQVLSIPSRIKEQTLALAQQPGAGLYGLGSQAIAGNMALFEAAIKSGGDKVAGKSFGERFSEEYDKNYAHLSELYHPPTPAGQQMTANINEFLDKVVSGLGDVAFKEQKYQAETYAKETGTKPVIPVEKQAAAAGAFTEALATLGILTAPGLKGKGEVKAAPAPVLTGNVLSDFVAKYPGTYRRMEASHVGDAPVAAAKAAQPERHFARIVEDAVNKEIGLSKYQDLAEPLLNMEGQAKVTLGDKIRLIVQKYAAQAKETIPAHEQVEYANTLIKKIFELQQQATAAELAKKPLALPAPKPQVAFDEPIIVDPAGVATIHAKYRASLDQIAEWQGTTVDPTGVAGREILQKYYGVPRGERLTERGTPERRTLRPEEKRSGIFKKQAGILDIDHLADNIGAIKNLGEGVTKYMLAGLVDPPYGLAHTANARGDVTLFRVVPKGEDTSLKAGAYLTADNSYLASRAADGKQVIQHTVPVKHLVESSPGSYIYTPPGTDLGPVLKYRDGDGRAITFADFLPPESINRPGLRGQSGAVDITGETPSTNRPTTSLRTDTLMSIRAKDRGDAATPKQPGRLAAVQESIKQYGIKHPVQVLISDQDQLAYLTNGNHRVLAASNLGIESVPIKIEHQATPFTDVQKSYARPVSELGLQGVKIQKPTTPQKGATFEDMKRIFGKHQRGVLDIDGIEKNTEEAKKAIVRATGAGWAVSNPEAAAQYVKDVMNGNEVAMEKNRKVFSDNIVKKARRAIYAHDYDLRKALQNAGPLGQVAHDRMVVQHGATMAAKVKIDAVNKDIFNPLNHEDRMALDELTRLRRIVQIDKYKGIGVVRHEGGITGPMAGARINQMKNELGPDAFNKLNNASTSIFEEQKILLDELKDNGVITPELHKKLYNFDYTRTQYLDAIDPMLPIASHIHNLRTSVRSSGIATLGYGKKMAVNINSQDLLIEDIARVENRIFRNNTLLAVRELAKRNPGNDIVRMPGPKMISTLANGDQVMHHTPDGYTSIGVRVKGKQEFILMKDDYAEQFIDRPEGIPEWLAVTFRTVSGTSLLKTSSTSMNPGFVIAGIPMDIFHTWMTASDVYSPHLPMYLMQMGKDMLVTSKDAFTKTGAWEDAMNEGLGSSYLTHESRSLTDPKKSIASIMTPKLARTREALSYLNDTTDMWIRLAYRNRLIDSDMEPWRATAMSRDRLDYFQGGPITKAFDSFIPYANVTIQATGKALEAAKRDPGAFMTKTAWIVGTAASVKIANIISSPETDKTIPVMDKVRNFNITFGDQYYTFDANGNKRYMYVPIRLDQVIMPLNAAVVGGLEKAEYGRAPNGITGNAIGQVSPVSGAFPIPSIDAVATYVTNYDEFTDRPIYSGPKVRPEDEVRSFGTGQPTSSAAIAAGQLTGMSPMRLQAAAGKLVNTNNVYIQAMGGAYRYLFEGSNPRDQATSTMLMLQHVPGLRNIVKFTTPYGDMMDDLTKAEQQVGSITSRSTQELNDLIFQEEHGQNNVTVKTIETYINNQPAEMRQKLADHAKYTLNVDKIMAHYTASDNVPPRTWWINSAKAPAEVRAQVFYNQWVSAAPEDRQRMLSIAQSLQAAGVGYLSPDFQKAFMEERKLLGDEQR